jgi:hypothetical protein
VTLLQLAELEHIPPPMSVEVSVAGHCLVKMRLCASILLDFLSNLGQFHMVGVQAHNLDIAVDPGVVPWLAQSRATSTPVTES